MRRLTHDADSGRRVAVRELARLRHDVRRSVAAHPAVYLPFARRKYNGSVLADDTRLVIDGFTRSAVTFAVVAFQLAQNGHVRVAHHLHSSGHVVAAAERRVPILMPIREPKGVVVSALVREPLITPAQFLKSYVAFHERILPYRDRLVVATFEQVTTDFGRVIERVNERFGSRFRLFEHTDDNVGRCFELIDQRAGGPPWRRLLGGFLNGTVSADEYAEGVGWYREGGARPLTIPEHRVQRPSTLRSVLTAEVEPLYDTPALARLRRRAETVYERFAEASGSA